MSIRHWPGPERPREKRLERGAHALSDAQLRALRLGSRTRGRSAIGLAHTRIAEFGSLRDLLNADRRRCLAQHGAGEVRRQMLLHNAAAVIFAHNQPLCCVSGVTTGSGTSQLGAGWRR